MSSKHRIVLERADRLLRRGDASDAVNLCRQVLLEDPDDTAALALFSTATQQLNDFNSMLNAARRNRDLQPGDVQAELRLAECHLLCCNTRLAARIAENVEKQAGGQTDTLLRVAEFYVHLGRHADAYRCNLMALEQRATNPEALFSTAASCVALGNLEQAEILYNRVIRQAPEDYDARYNRSTLRRQTPDNNHIEQLLFELERIAPDHPGQVPLCYAAAKELEDLGRHDESFTFLQRGANLRRSRLAYEVTSDETVMARIADKHDASILELEIPGHSSERPVFVLGLPRSGTTLVDRIISAHSEVDSLGEINTFALALIQAAGPHKDRDELIDRSPALDFSRIGELYCRGIDGFGKRAPRLVDKTPLNFLYLGMIRAALPGARVIHLRRNPVDSCYAMYKTLFRMGYPFSYRLQDVGRYYIAYHGLMAHWRRIMPDFFLDVDYEALVCDTEPQVRRILEFLELDWQENCLEFHRQATPSATASAAQVRQPIYSSSVGIWRNYSRQLAPFAARLREYGIETE